MPLPKLEYSIGSRPTGYLLAFEPFLYNQEAFLALKDYPIQSFYAINHQKRSIEARIHFTIREQQDGTLQAISLPELPFGSLEYSTSLTNEQLSDFLAFVREQLTQQQVRSIEIRDCIPSYRTDIKIFYQVLQELGFLVKDEQVNYHISVDSYSLLLKMKAGQKGRLAKSIKAEFIVVKEPVEKLCEVYRFIEMSYQTRQRKLSIPLRDLQKYAEAFPDRYLLFSVCRSQDRVASCIAVQVSHSIVYTFYYTALLTYSSYSPTVLLLSHIYRYCQSNELALLDLGIGSESIQNFKRRMGGVASYKKSYLLKW
ncbi:GNAT family N-acetyltransferase [Tunicatimonas pelagia]|uniref:GNAT family N-acetyltransferase n=1 Tax=Tunicatimonas pelagia TaxID=931531 RepID=UPI002666AB58|nr:GNAT family N-acetyltransferase [Tunicatimonas pelagia]WKN41475.1 GNAT family N-acetyltransferase [Tunicatimonas pelagia]